MKFKIFWAWFDFWVGFYYDVRKDILYFCPIPTLVLAFSLRDNEIPTAEYDGTQKKVTTLCAEVRKEEKIKCDECYDWSPEICGDNCPNSVKSKGKRIK